MKRRMNGTRKGDPPQLIVVRDNPGGHTLQLAAVDPLGLGDAEGIGDDRVVLYRGEDQVTRFVTIPDETFSLQNAQDAIRKFEAERRLTTPHRFTL